MEKLSFEWAVKQYADELERHGALFIQPSNSSEFADGVWHLINGNGDLANVYSDGTVELLPRQ